jgi:WD40 repeat protein
MERVIRGEFTEFSIDELRKVLPKKKLMVFVSSTFLDTNLERYVLHKNILPDLQKMAQEHEIQIIFYDMRFGVKDENTLDHMTWIACKEAIQQCYDGSDGLFFLSLQSDRYGYLPLPKYLDQDILETAVKDHMNDSNSEQINVMIKKWYLLDRNHCPPRYELKPLSCIKDSEYWKNVLPSLRDSLLNLVAFETLKVERLLINHSVTEWETLYAFNCDKDRCHWVQRLFEKDSWDAFKSHPDSWKLTDIFETPSPAEKLEMLKTKMKFYLREDQRVELNSQILPSDYFQKELCDQYLQEWERAARDCLEKELQKVILKTNEWKRGVTDIPAEHLEEIIHHCSTVLTKNNNFFGREELLATALEKLNTTATARSGPFSGVNLALIGKSGCGKTAMMSKLAVSVCGNSTHRKVPTIVRFCGTSKFSLNGLSLIQSISIQLLAAHQEPFELRSFLSALPLQDYKKSVERFHRLIAEYPVNLFIDSLDQLENSNEERSKLSFLRDILPHQQSRIIVSFLPDEYDENGNPGHYFYQCERTLKADQVPFIEVGTMDKTEAIIKSLLHSRCRTLTSDQWTATLNAVSYEPTVLYINLAVEVISQWRSFGTTALLKSTVKGLIHQIFDELEKNYGKEFTSIALSMITFSREGINDMEMQNLLSLHDGVLKEVFQYSSLYCFPMHAWLRLKYVVKNMVAEKENHCINWYHRQLWETATERYSEKAKECHEIMGRYFSNMIETEIKKEKGIYDQPLTLNELVVWNPRSVVNRRRAVEGYYHLIKGKLLNEAIVEVCSLEFICCSALAGDVLKCVHYLGELTRYFDILPELLDHYYRWILKKATRIVNNPRLEVRMTGGEEPEISAVKQKVKELYEKERKEIGRPFGLQTLHSGNEFDAMELELVGHSKSVNALSWSNDGNRIVSGSYDNKIKIWDGATGELLKTLEGHSGEVSSVAWNYEGSKILSGSSDRTIRIWDGRTGELLIMLREDFTFVFSGEWSRDGKKIAGTLDNIIKIWNAMNGKLLHTLKGHLDSVTSVAWSHDGFKLFSGSVDKTIKMWDGKTGELLKTWEEAHDMLVQSVTCSLDGSKLISSGARRIKIWDLGTCELLKTLVTGSGTMAFNQDRSKIAYAVEKSVFIYDLIAGERLRSLMGHSETVYSVSWNRDGTKVVTGSADQTIKIWNVERNSSEEEFSRFEVVTSLAWNFNNGQIVSGSNMNALKIWDSSTGELLKSLNDPEDDRGNISSVSWNTDGTKIVSGSTNTKIKIWNPATGELVKTLEGHSDEFKSVAWNHDCTKIATGFSDGSILISDGLTGEPMKACQGSFKSLRSLDWNHASTAIVSGAYDTIVVWDATTTTTTKPGFVKSLVRMVNGDVLKTLKCDGGVNSVVWNHDGTKIASASEFGNMIIWDATTGQQLKTVENRRNYFSKPRVTWNHDSSKIISGPWLTTLKIWETVNWQLLSSVEIFSRPPSAVTWNSEGTQVAFACGDCHVRVWSENVLPK